MSRPMLVVALVLFMALAACGAAWRASRPKPVDPCGQYFQEDAVRISANEQGGAGR